MSVSYEQGHRLQSSFSSGQYNRKNNVTCFCFQKKAGSSPLHRNASLERHTQRFLELRRDLQQIEYFCKGTVLQF
jgi:hypothetical protein